MPDVVKLLGLIQRSVDTVNRRRNRAIPETPVKPESLLEQ